jgi:hypothetical protein
MKAKEETYIMSNVDLTDIITGMVPESERSSGYLVDLSAVQFDEPAANASADEPVTSWVHALSVGKFKHPLWGWMNFSAERIQRFAASVTSKVRGIDISIDYEHQADEGGKAAGWVKTAEARTDGLWLFVEWTKAAAERIRNKEFRYFSSEFVDEWQDAQGKTHKDVLLGGGLTNRPFLKDLVPVNLSEFAGRGKGKEKEDEPMKELLKALGLSEDATEEEAIAKLAELTAEPEPPKDPPKVEEPPVDPSLTKLAEDNPGVKALMDEVTRLTAESKHNNATKLVEGWSSNSKEKYALPPAVTTKLTEVIEDYPGIADKFSEIMTEVLKTGLVKLGEEGTSRPKGRPSQNGVGDATAEFNEEVRKLQEADPKLTYAEATTEVSRSHEKLYLDMRRETVAGILVEEEETEEVSS